MDTNKTENRSGISGLRFIPLVIGAGETGAILQIKSGFDANLFPFTDANGAREWWNRLMIDVSAILYGIAAHDNRSDG